MPTSKKNGTDTDDIEIEAFLPESLEAAASIEDDPVCRESWESVYIDGEKTGYAYRLITRDAASELLICDAIMTFKLQGNILRFSNTYYFKQDDDYAWVENAYDNGFGRVVSIIRRDDTIKGEITEDSLDEVIEEDNGESSYLSEVVEPVDMPCVGNTRPSWGYFTAVISMPFEEGYSYAFTNLDVNSLQTEPSRFECLGWEDQDVLGNTQSLWKIQEYNDEMPTNVYWLDSERRLVKTDWQGAIAYLVSERKDALKGLAKELKP